MIIFIFLPDFLLWAVDRYVHHEHDDYCHYIATAKVFPVLHAPHMTSSSGWRVIIDFPHLRGRSGSSIKTGFSLYENEKKNVMLGAFCSNDNTVLSFLSLLMLSGLFQVFPLMTLFHVHLRVECKNTYYGTGIPPFLDS